MTRGESLKRLVKGSDMHIMIRFDGIEGAVDADMALKIWEQLSIDADPVKQDPVKKEAPKQKTEPKPVKKAAGNKKPLDDGKMLALRKAGWTYDKIADEMRCSTQTAINHIKDKE